MWKNDRFKKGLLAAAFALVVVPLPASGGEAHYWEDPAFQGPPQGMYYDPDVQSHYESFLWPETMKAREVWSNKKQEIDDLPTPSKLLMLGNRRKALENYQLMHERMGEDCRQDRMNRGLSPKNFTEDVKWEI